MDNDNKNDVCVFEHHTEANGIACNLTSKWYTLPQLQETHQTGPASHQSPAREASYTNSPLQDL